jgi:hypothetical protein
MNTMRYEEYRLVDCNGVQLGEYTACRTKIPIPFSGSKSKPSKKPVEADDKLGAVLFTVTAMRTSNPRIKSFGLHKRRGNIFII